MFAELSGAHRMLAPLGAMPGPQRCSWGRSLGLILGFFWLPVGAILNMIIFNPYSGFLITKM